MSSKRQTTITPDPGIPGFAALGSITLSSLTAILITVALGLFLFLVLGAVSISGLYVYFQISDQIAPGVNVGDIELSGSTQTQAAIELQQSWNHNNQILVTNGSQIQVLSPAELGISIEPLMTAQDAYEVGRSGTVIARIAQLFASWKDGWQIIPLIYIDDAATRAGLESLIPEMSQPPQNAAIRVEGSTLVTVPSELGYTINLGETINTFRESPQEVIASGILNVTPKPVMPDIMDVSGVITEAHNLLNSAPSLQTYDPVANEYKSWSVPREYLINWFTVKASEQGPQITLDEDQVAEFLTILSQGLNPPSYIDAHEYSSQVAGAINKGQIPTVIVKHRPTIYIVQPGDTMLKIGWRLGMPYWIILQANPDFNPDALQAGSELIIPSKDHLLPLPVIPHKRIIISISKQRMWVLQDGQTIGKHIISTGIDRSPTQPGVFQVQTHDPNAYASVWDLNMPYFLGIYETWPGFLNGLHGLPTLSNGRRLWANILGSPASYGCIILDLNTAEWLYSWAEDGVIVEVQP